MTSDIKSRRILRIKQVQEIVPLSTSHIYALIDQGKFPAPVKLLRAAKAADGGNMKSMNG